MAKQDEKQRLKRRLQDHAVELAATNRWSEAVEVNRQVLELGDDPDAYNRLGKAQMELGLYRESHDAYQQTLRLNPTNTIARKNLSRLESLLERGIEQSSISRNSRQQVDLRLFITETGRTALTTLTDVPRNSAIDALVTGEKVDFRVDGRNVHVIDADDNIIGRLEPKLAQRLAELINGGNRYITAVAQSDARQIRLLIRETYQDPSQRGRISFPGKLGEGAMYIPNLRYEDYPDDLLEDDDGSDEGDGLSRDYSDSDEEEEIGLDEIEQDVSDEDESMDG